MVARAALIVGLVALAACAGCGMNFAAVDSSTTGQGDQIPRCSSGTYYNRAAAMCVSPGGA